MSLDPCSPLDRDAVLPGPGSPPAGNRRTRLEKGLPEELVGWLHRTTRVHAHLLAVVRLYGNPSRAGGQSSEGGDYAARAAQGDRTMLYDALTVARDELDEVREEVHRVMESAAPTEHPPGTREKIDVMRDRMSRGDSVFIPGDATTHVG